MFICVAIAGSGGLMALFFAATLGSLAVRLGTVFGIVITLCCITCVGVAREIAQFSVTVGVT